jgi:hypothetical protein
MPLATRHRAPLSIPRPARMTAPAAVADRDVYQPSYTDVYELLSEAAHLLSRAGRELRKEHLSDGLAVQGLADNVHTHIRKLPAAARHLSAS